MKIIVSFYRKDKKIINFILKVFLVWRFALFVFAYLGQKLLPFKHSFPYVKEVLQPFGSQLLWSWANFDGVHYLGIAQKGYFAQYTQAFFPGYPLLVKYLNLIIGNYLVAGLLISNLSFIIALYFLYRLVILDYSKAVAKKTILLLVLFPTSFFFGAYYSESLFLLLLLISFYSIRKNQSLTAGIGGFLAAIVRFFGILLLPVFLYEWYEKTRKKKEAFTPRNFKNLVFLLLPLLGLGLYMRYLAVNFSDPFYFAHAQPAFGASRSVDKAVLLYQVFYRYIKMMFTFQAGQLMYYTVLLELLSALLFGGLLILGYLKKIRMSYLIYAVPTYLIPTLTGTFSSMPRYVLILFPCFITLALIEKKWVKNIATIVFALLLAFSTILFTRGYWVG